MSCDIAVSFVRSDSGDEAELQKIASKVLEAEEIYLLTGNFQAQEVGLFFFSFWASSQVNLQKLCEDLSRKYSPICLSWKSEHGGVAGYSIFSSGSIVKSDSSSDEDYLFLPSLGLESGLGVALDFSADDRVFFPEILLDDSVRCFKSLNQGTSVSFVELPSTVIDQILEDDLDVEPILPVSLF